MNIFSLEQREIEVILAIANVTLGFLAYYFVGHCKKIQSWIEAKYKIKQSGSIVLFKRICGVLFLGMIPLLVTVAVSGKDLREYGFSPENLKESLLWTGLVSGIILIMNVINARKPVNLAMYPEIRVRNWSPRLLVQSSVAWIVYLLAYEILFRGLLLFTFDTWFGPVIATAINVSIYSLVHVHKGIKEALGAIPFGILICWITLYTGNIWPAVGIHIIMALSNEYLSLYFHPEISLKKR